MLVTTPVDMVFAASPHRDSHKAYVTLQVLLSGRTEVRVARGRAVMVRLLAINGGRRGAPLPLRADALRLEVRRVGGDAGALVVPFELLADRAWLDSTVDLDSGSVSVRWLLSAAATRGLQPGRYRLMVAWGDATDETEFEVVEKLPTAALELRSRRTAALDTGEAAHYRGAADEMEAAADAMLPELPGDSALLCLKAEALELKGDIRGAYLLVNKAMSTTEPPPGTVAREPTNPDAYQLEMRLFNKLMRQFDGGRP